MSWKQESFVDYYNVYYRTETDNFGSAINVGTTSTYTITGLEIGTYYNIVITAYTSAGGESVNSLELAVITVDVPNKPTGLTTTNVAENSVSFTWTLDPTVDYYHVHYKQ